MPIHRTQQLIEPDGQGSTAEQLSESPDIYLQWIEVNSRTWTKLMRSAASLPEGWDLLEEFRTQTLQQLLRRLTGRASLARAAQRAEWMLGYVGYVDATLLDWTQQTRPAP